MVRLAASYLFFFLNTFGAKGFYKSFGQIRTWFTLIEHIFDYSCTIGISNRATSVVLFVVRSVGACLLLCL